MKVYTLNDQFLLVGTSLTTGLRQCFSKCQAFVAKWVCTSVFVAKWACVSVFVAKWVCVSVFVAKWECVSVT